MAEEAKKDAAAPAEGEEEKKGGNLVLVIGIIVGIVILQTALVYLIVPKPVKEGDAELARAADSIKAAADAATKMGAVTSDAPIEAIVNLAGTEGERFLKATIILEYDEKNVALGTELRNRAPKFKNLFIDYLANLTMAEASEPGVRDKISKDMLRLINASLPVKLGEVNNVLFTTFIIQ